MHILLILLLPILAFAVPFRAPPRGSIAPYLSGDTFRAYCDFAYDEITPYFPPTSVKRGSTIFVNGDYLQKFFQRIHPQIKVPYILISHNTDMPIPGNFRNYLDDDKIIAWFTQNQDETVHPKLHTLPIALENRQWKPTNVQTIQRVNGMHLSKTHLVYCNFSPTSYLPERPYVQALFKDAPFVYFAERKEFDPYIEDIASSKFVISPRGNGLDTHRLWETLYSGSFPVVKTSSLDTLYQDLPVVIVSEWTDVTEEFLHQKYEELTAKTYSYDKLYTNYWFRWIDSYKK